jgi:beta-ribofuranosylaminobenzene 5'-phosphate synthase
MIEVETFARLHLGLLDNNGEQGRLYGSIGVAVNHPRLLLRADSAKRLVVEGPEKDRITMFARRFIKHYDLRIGARLNLLAGIPAHIGLGSGTQLALATGTALAKLAGLRLSIREIALAVGRGIHSGIGISTFRHGGFVLDGGHKIVSESNTSSKGNRRIRQVDKNSIPPVLFRHSIPMDWIFVIAVPAVSHGFSGEKESNAFLQLPQAPASLVEKISRVLLIKMLPALVEKDIENFGRALTDIQCMVGDCFASAQGGRFANPVSEKVVDFLLNKGAAGIGQSSWGPTVYGLVKGKAKARLLAFETQVFLSSIGGGYVFRAQPQNRGAQLRDFSSQ